MDAMNLRTRGYTLHELLSSLAIVSLLLGIAVPEAQRFRANQQLASASNTLATSLALARSESIKRQRPVLIDNGDGDWASGWQVFVDLNNNGQADDGESILRQDAALPGRHRQRQYARQALYPLHPARQRATPGRRLPGRHPDHLPRVRRPCDTAPSTECERKTPSQPGRSRLLLEGNPFRLA
ncbi:GspH/FimT family pseudopilin [Pseudomonas lalucatii]|nr:GspH/FimT family pseudopilin [Pseudomonas lalucatii]